MPKVTFDITPSLRALMDKNPEVNWSAVFRISIQRHARQAEIARQIQQEMDDPRVQAFAAALKKGAGERWRRARGG